MRRHIPLLVLLSTAIAVCRACYASAEMPQDVSMVQLLATPEKFHGKVVRVFGFLCLEFEGDALYLHREDNDQGLTRNGVWIHRTEAMDRDEKKLNKHYVLVEATFDGEQHGHMGAFGGALKDVTRIIPWPPVTHQ
jgi:hypothetical protein